MDGIDGWTTTEARLEIKDKLSCVVHGDDGVPAWVFPDFWLFSHPKITLPDSVTIILECDENDLRKRRRAAGLQFAGGLAEKPSRQSTFAVY